MKIILAVVLILFILSPGYSQKYESKSHCFSLCQATFRDQLSKCREEKNNTSIRTACLDRARVMLNSCLDECRDQFPDKIK